MTLWNNIVNVTAGKYVQLLLSLLSLPGLRTHPFRPVGEHSRSVTDNKGTKLRNET